MAKPLQWRIGLFQQLLGIARSIDAFKFGIGAGKADPNGLYAIWAGPNDFLDFLGGSSVEDPAVLVAQGAANLTYAATTLNSLGAKKIVLPNMADLGQLPFSRGFQTEATAISKAFNAAVALELGNLKFDVAEVDLFATTQEVGKNPAKFGFTNPTDPLLPLQFSSTPPSNPEQFFFWDVFHPTTQGHAVLAGTIDRTLTGEIPQLSFNQIFGTKKNDDLEGTSANDDLRGDAGNDILSGRRGDDRLQGEDGNDRLFGERGDDILSGGNGDDYLWGGQGNDIAFGGVGHDRLWGELGDDILIGDDGDDLIYGGAGNDYLLGGSGRDLIWGDAGQDILNGGDGDDCLFGGAGNDTLFGGLGADQFRLTNLLTQGIDRIQDFQSGIDKIAVSALGLGSGFMSGKAITADQFLETTNSTATTINQRLIYDSKTGGLFFDADGSGFGSSSVQFATLYVDPLNPAQLYPIGLTSADFSIV